ncbi:LysE family transporter [Paenibacillus thermotolerans]|uniref:LysE family transporter n=1 Tax=Paenibacillus thermotolerans TaxID=3027807 RepID=UPI0023688079|nr:MULTISPECIES: LysE family transporter [unclassified Paenibacillus]
MLLTSLFFSGFALSLSLCLDLGTVNVAIIRAGVVRGFRPSFLIGVGSSFGDLTYAVLAATGITFLLGYEPVRWFLWLGGTAALLYFTIGMVKAAWKPKALQNVSDDAAGNGRDNDKRWKDFFWGYGLAMSSPTAILWFATVGGSVIANSPVRGAGALSVFFAGFFAASIVWSLGVAALSSAGGRSFGPVFIRVISVLSALLFLYLAVHVFINGYVQLIRQ